MARLAAPRPPCVLVIAGLDPSGGAGLLADARAVHRAGAFACGAVSLLTVQSTKGVRSVTPLPADELVRACEEVLATQRISAIKVGALGSIANVEAIGALLARHPHLPSVVDTVMLPTRGRSALLADGALQAMWTKLLPHTTVVMANAAEAARLVRANVKTANDARMAALLLRTTGSRVVVVKGGHLDETRAVDVVATFNGREPEIIELDAPRLALDSPVHGAGCVLASLTAGHLARAVRSASDESRRTRSTKTPTDLPLATLVESIRLAKKMHHALLKHPIDIGDGMHVLATNDARRKA